MPSFDCRYADNLFFTGSPTADVADYVYSHGFDRKVPRMSLDSALLSNTSIWRTFQQIFRYGLLKRPADITASCNQEYVLVKTRGASGETRDFEYLHPLFRTPSMVPAGKTLHAYAITWETSPRHDPFETDSDPMEMSPLVSQPLIELSLSIPTYVLTENGRDRAIARKAFADELPERILRRKSKGGQEEHVKDVLLSNRRIVQDMLLNGQLVQRGYIDKDALLTALNYSPAQFKCDPGELISILFLEAWLLSWSQERHRSAA